MGRHDGRIGLAAVFLAMRLVHASILDTACPLPPSTLNLRNLSTPATGSNLKGG
jgi:hypothetical protein